MKTNLSEKKMTAIRNNHQQHQDIAPVQQLQRWSMIVDGNQHHQLSYLSPSECPHEFMLSEALIPQLRLMAILIAAQRLNHQLPTPAIISDEADWFAARILVMGIRVFHLDITLIPMLKTANLRARKFARQHQLLFTPAQMRMSLHAGRPERLLIVETSTQIKSDLGIIQNSLNFAKSACLSESEIIKITTNNI